VLRCTDNVPRDRFEIDVLISGVASM
jgi:hypothetical protein